LRFCNSYRFFRLWFGLLARCFRSHRTLLLENLALRQQLTVLKRKHRKPKVGPLDKLQAGGADLRPSRTVPVNSLARLRFSLRSKCHNAETEMRNQWEQRAHSYSEVRNMGKPVQSQ